MSDENAAASGEPSEAPTTPGPSAEGAESPTQPQPAPTAPSADEPITAAPVDEPVTVADPPAEAPTEVAPPAATSPGAPAGAAAATPEALPATAAAATAEESGAKGRGVFIPAWVAVVVGVLVIAGLGFAIGWMAAPNDDGVTSNAAATSPAQNGNSNGNGNSSSNGNGQNVPSTPGNGNDDSSGDSSGDSTTPPLPRGAYLGVSVESAANNGGATIASVAADSPAASAGLEEGDVVTAVDGTQVTSALDLVRQIREHDVDDSITITYTRNGSTDEAKVTLDSRPASQSVS
ncbi:MAG: PDZ domain-containing protein [Acidimicrobiia bacterium]